MFKKENKNEVRKAKHSRIRHTLSGSADMPRLNVYRSLKEISAA
jgi:large subunit ribosomal protein L18